jgi:hypothetical protein
MRCEDVDWIYFAQDRVQWPTVVNTVMNLHGSIKGKRQSACRNVVFDLLNSVFLCELLSLFVFYCFGLNNESPKTPNGQ